MSVYDMILGYMPDMEGRGDMDAYPVKPKYFNEIAVPDTWSFHAGDRKSGEISYLHERKGTIRYIDSEKPHLVEAVDWHDGKGVVRLTDLGAYENVSLYPGTKVDVLEGLFERCDYYYGSMGAFVCLSF